MVWFKATNLSSTKARIFNHSLFYPVAGALTGIISVALIIQLEDYLRPAWVWIADAFIPAWPYFGGAVAGILLGCVVLLFKPSCVRD